MAVKWSTTKYPGVRFRKHPTRKHGVDFDRYFTIRFRRHGKQIEEGVGWSYGGWNAKKASGLLSELEQNYENGIRPDTLADKKALITERREAKKKLKRSRP